MGHHMMGVSLATTGDFAQGRAHSDQAVALYDPAVHRLLVTRFGGADWRVAILSFRSLTLWMLGYPEAALNDADDAIKDAREIGQAPTLMLALARVCHTEGSCGNYVAANALGDELVALADKKGAPEWKEVGMLRQGWFLSLRGKAAEAVQVITSGLANRIGTLEDPFFLSSLARAHAELGQFDDAWRSIGEAVILIEKTKERLHEAEVNRIAGEIALKSPQSDAAKAEAYFERALAVARKQQAKSWELRAAMSMARLWRDQGKQTEARELLVPVYRWFTTLELLRGIAERGALAPLFVLITARPEFRPPWGVRSHHGTISLAPLDRHQVRHMVGELAARHALPKEVVEGVTERTGGVPLFVEEVTRLLLERGEQGGIQVIPPTLQQSLTARLDRLGPAREVAQIGSVIGRGFSYRLLREVAGMAEALLQASLEKLAEADIVLVQGLPPDSDYRFKHALIQDAAYEKPAQEPAPGAAPPRRRDFARPLHRYRGGRAGSASAPLRASGPD
jgi:tetratricopeptide (TPR) repeat protein